MSQTTKKWKMFGWRNISFEIPGDWALGSISGNEEAGYFRLDDMEMPRMEVKWTTIKKKKRAPSLQDVVDNFLNDLEKSVKRKKFDIHIEYDVDPLRYINGIPGKEMHGFLWKSSTRAFGIATYCEECRRVVISQVVAKLQDDISNVVPRIFGSFQDHAVDGISRWSVYDMEFAVPEEYTLKSQQLMPAYLEFVFTAGREPYELKVERWGMSDVHLKNDRPVGDWYKRRYDKVLKPYRLEYGRLDANGHEAIGVKGVRRRFLHEMRVALENIVHSKTPTNLHGSFWHCPETKKIFVVTLSNRSNDSGPVEFVTSHVRCHERDEERGETETALHETELEFHDRETELYEAEPELFERETEPYNIDTALLERDEDPLDVTDYGGD